MAIPEAQLETWSHQGSVQQSSSTYQTIKNSLDSSTSSYAGKSYSFLQGSYGNDTNIWAESDVDTVIRFNSIFRYDLDTLPPQQAAVFRQNVAPALHSFSDFKQGVITQLSTTFSAENVIPGKKAILIKPSTSRRKADVIACYEYRRYTRYINDNDCDFKSGIIFPTVAHGEIINYPQIHSENLTLKHQATSEWFKPMVRILKNMRSRLVENGVISKDVAPSYYIEGMLYNVPNAQFGGNYADTFCNSINWLSQADKTKLVCAHSQYYLLGDSNVQWPTNNCNLFLTAVSNLWNNW